jgi:hypothetical protein
MKAFHAAIYTLWGTAMTHARKHCGEVTELEYTTPVFGLDGRPVQAVITIKVSPVALPAIEHQVQA